MGRLQSIMSTELGNKEVAGTAPCMMKGYACGREDKGVRYG